MSAPPYYTFTYNLDPVDGVTPDPINAQAMGAALIATADADFEYLAGLFPPQLFTAPMALPFEVLIMPDPTSTEFTGIADYGTGTIQLLLPVNLIATNQVDRARAVLLISTTTLFIANQYKNGLGLEKVDYDWDGVGALSMLPALARYPATASTMDGINDWISSSWIDSLDDAYDTPSNRVGCKLLFYDYLVSQLGYTMQQVLQTPALSQVALYHSLPPGHTDDPFPAFAAVLKIRYQPNVPNQIAGCTNPFPIRPAPPVVVEPPVIVRPPLPPPLPPVRPPQTTCAQLQIMIDQLQMKTDKTIQEVENLQTYKDWYANQCVGADPGRVVDPVLAPMPIHKTLGESGF